MADFFVLVFFYFCEKSNRHASQERIFQKDHLQEHLYGDESRETAEASSRNRSLRSKGSQESSQKEEIMKHITLDRIITILLTAVIVLIHQKQIAIDSNQDQRIGEFFNELELVKSGMSDSASIAVDSILIDSVE